MRSSLAYIFRAPPKDYNRVIVIAHALAQLRTITFLEPSSEGVVCNEHGIVLAAFEKGKRVHWLSRRAMSVTVGHLKVPDVTLCSTVCRGSSPPCTLQDTRRLNVRLCNRAESYPTVKRSSADEGETEVFPFS